MSLPVQHPPKSRYRKILMMSALFCCNLLPLDYYQVAFAASELKHRIAALKQDLSGAIGGTKRVG